MSNRPSGRAPSPRPPRGTPRNGCAASWQKPATSCAPRSPQSAATPSTTASAAAWKTAPPPPPRPRPPAPRPAPPRPAPPRPAPPRPAPPRPAQAPRPPRPPSAPRRTGGLVEDMLVLARLDLQRPIERRPVDLLTLAADAVQDARIVAPSRAIDLTVGTGAAFLVLGDEGRLRQVISNLMNNALTHTPEGSPITVRLLAGHQQGNPPVPCAVLE